MERQMFHMLTCFKLNAGVEINMALVVTARAQCLLVADTVEKPLVICGEP
jgi:hypothetical protein